MAEPRQTFQTAVVADDPMLSMSEFVSHILSSLSKIPSKFLHRHKCVEVSPARVLVFCLWHGVWIVLIVKNETGENQYIG